jgi:hypothetical protein
VNLPSVIRYPSSSSPAPMQVANRVMIVILRASDKDARGISTSTGSATSRLDLPYGRLQTASPSPCFRTLSKLGSLRVKLSHSFPPVFPLSPIFRTFFQVPYPVTPLFATLTKTAGVCTQNSPFWNRFTPYLAEAPFITRHRIQVLSFQILPHSSALFCARAKLDSFLFKRFRTLRRKTARGGGAHPISRYNWRCGRKRAG